MTQPYDAYDYAIGAPIPPTHRAYQCRRGAEPLATCAALTANHAARHFFGRLGIDPAGVEVVAVSSRHPVTAIGE